MSNQIIYSAVYLPNIRFRYGLQNKAVTCRKSSHGFFFCPKFVHFGTTISLFFLHLAHEINHNYSHYEESIYSLFRIAL